jgi:hypothetical protein
VSTRTLEKLLDQSSRLNAKLDILISGQKSLEERIAKLEEVSGNKSLDKDFEKVLNSNNYLCIYFYIYTDISFINKDVLIYNSIKIFANCQNCLIIYVLYI